METDRDGGWVKTTRPYGVTTNDWAYGKTVGVDRFDRPAYNRTLRAFQPYGPLRGGFTAGLLCRPLVNPYGVTAYTSFLIEHFTLVP